MLKPRVLFILVGVSGFAACFVLAVLGSCSPRIHIENVNEPVPHSGAEPAPPCSGDACPRLSRPAPDSAEVTEKRDKDPKGPWKVALIGDSQSTGVYGKTLHELIVRRTPHVVQYFGAASSAQVRHWVSGGFTAIPSGSFLTCSTTQESSCIPSFNKGGQTISMAQILARHPELDLVVYTLGDNHFGDPRALREQIPLLVRPVTSRGLRCAWVSPTVGGGRFADKSLLLSEIRAGLDLASEDQSASCRVIDSLTVGGAVLRDARDAAAMRSAVARDSMQLHPQGDGARLWAERAFEALSKLFWENSDP